MSDETRPASTSASARPSAGGLGPITRSAAAAADAPAAAPRPAAKPKIDRHGFALGTGRRKAAVARVRVKPGSGKYLINNREMDQFFTEPQYRKDALAPLAATNTQGKMDVYVKVEGGGITGQAGAILLGLARALKNYDPSIESTLRDNGYLTRDAREVERKKPGQPGARRRFQFSKR